MKAITILFPHRSVGQRFWLGSAERFHRALAEAVHLTVFIWRLNWGWVDQPSFTVSAGWCWLLAELFPLHDVILK